MAEPKTHAAFTDLWRSVSKLNHNNNNNNNNNNTQEMPGSSAHVVRQDLQSPKQRRCSRYAALHHGDSPGDVEPTQDIIWDPTSPTATAGGPRNSRVVQISDIVNRIAPEDESSRASESPLLQWIGDGVPSTPDVPKPRVRKRSSRQSSVDDLLKLARQFDQNMQQDRVTSDPALAPPPPDPEEAELHALFDCSTQRVSGRLSQGSAPSTQEVQIRALKDASGHDDFDDDWDDVVNDPVVIAMTQNPQEAKPTNRRTFQLGPAPHFLSAAKTPSVPIPKTETRFSDSDDDALLYQACDRIERSQPYGQNAAAPPPPNRKSFLRSNSLPGATGGETASYRGWDVTMTGADRKSGMSQSLPGGGASPGTFNRFGNSSQSFRNVKVTQQESSRSFKRNKSDSAVFSSKVLVPSQTLKCSAAEIERKKQEALARRRLRMQNNPKP